MFMCCLLVTAHAQHTFNAIIRNEEQHPLPSATITWVEQNRTVISDEAGLIAIAGIPDGKQTFTISFIGLAPQTLTYNFPLDIREPVVIILQHEDDEEEEVVVTATRTSRTIAHTPTRTEVISGEELDEKANMKPGDIRILLNESTGIQTQQTSATSFNAGIRIQGLDGRYTQILRDGYPLYAGFAGGLSILQIAPLDLQQVEVIKGSASTLYGGGAIAGLVDLVSKKPREERELSFMTNVTSARGLDLSGFYSEKYGKTGLTVFASRNTNGPFDPAGIGLTAIPKFERYTVHPRLFLYGKKMTADIGVTYITEDRTGGNVDYIKNGGSGFFETNNTDRVTTQLGITYPLGEHATLQFKNSYSHFNRNIAIPTYQFEALQQSSFSELTWNRRGEKTDWVAGVNFLTDDLKEQQRSVDPLRDYHYNTFGIFVQNLWPVSEQVILETGLRGDYVKEYGLELLPRISAMWKIAPAITTRLGGGFGYKTPTPFTEESERIQFRHVLPIDTRRSENERSVGGNWDFNYRTAIGPVSVNLNHLFFYTRLNRPLILEEIAGQLAFRNATGHIDTRGMETNLRLVYRDFKLFIGYTYTDANTHYEDIQEWMALTARHRLNNVLIYEVHGKLKLGLEAYYYSPQRLNDGKMGRAYWLTGFMAEKLWEKFSVFINFENFTDTRQTRFDSIYTGSIDDPVFRDIYAPVEGFVVNGGIKIRL